MLLLKGDLMSTKDQKIVIRKTIILYAVFSVVSLGIYLLWSINVFRVGFPLDDAWIHQTYARNLVNYREWSFVPGQPSAGSTSPLWTGILSIGYLVKLAPYFWTFLLGAVALFFTALIGNYAFRVMALVKNIVFQLFPIQ